MDIKATFFVRVDEASGDAMVVELFPFLQDGTDGRSSDGLVTGITWVDMQNYRDPPPYPGHSKQVYTNQPGFRQSFSGSETSTDVSLSSNENLVTSQRQEPQGEETQTSLYSHLDLDGNGYSILARLGIPPGAIENSTNQTTVPYTSSPPYDRSQPFQSKITSQGKLAAQDGSTNPAESHIVSPLNTSGHLTVPRWQLHNNGTFIRRSSNEREPGIMSSSSTMKHSVKEFSSTTVRSNIGSESSSCITSSSKAGFNVTSTGVLSTGSGGGIFMSSSLSSSSSSTSSSHQYLSPRVPPVSTYHHPHPYVNTNWTDLDNKNFTSPNISYEGKLKPPVYYPGGLPGPDKAADIRTCRSYEAMDKVERSGDCPSDHRLSSSNPGIYSGDTKVSSPQRSSNNSADETDAKASQMVGMLTRENRALREELAASSVKVARLQKLEMEIQKVHDSHAALIKSSQKRELLWAAMKRRLEERITVLEADTDSSNPGHVTSPDSEWRIKLAEKDALISKLVAQNQEINLAKDEMEGENAQLSLSIAEHKAQVDIYESALLNAQSKLLNLDEEFQKKQSSCKKVEHLQSALQSLQEASEKQEKASLEIRQRLERELDQYKKSGAKRGDATKDDDKSVGMLKSMLDEKDARILQLESTIAELEQKYVKEATMRQLNMEDFPQAPKEVRLAVLEKSSSDMGKLIDEATAQKLKFMEERYRSERQIAELEAKVKQLQTQLAEKEAMVKVFQSSPHTLSRSSSLHALCHTPRPSLIGPTKPPVLKKSGAIRHMKTGSTSALELGRKMSVEEDLLAKVQSLSADNKDSSEDEKCWQV